MLAEFVISTPRVFFYELIFWSVILFELRKSESVALHPYPLKKYSEHATCSEHILNNDYLSPYTVVFILFIITNIVFVDNLGPGARMRF